MRAISFSKTSVSTYQLARRHISEELHLNIAVRCLNRGRNKLYSSVRNNAFWHMTPSTYGSVGFLHLQSARQTKFFNVRAVWISDRMDLWWETNSTVAWKCSQVTPTELCMFWGSSGFVLVYDIQLTVIVGRQPYTSKAVAVKLKFPMFLQFFAVRGIQPLKK